MPDFQETINEVARDNLPRGSLYAFHLILPDGEKHLFTNLSNANLMKVCEDTIFELTNHLDHYTEQEKTKP